MMLVENEREIRKEYQNGGKSYFFEGENIIFTLLLSKAEFWCLARNLANTKSLWLKVLKNLKIESKIFIVVIHELDIPRRKIMCLK